VPFRKRSDNNQAEIVKAARKIGAFVIILSAVGGGCPDILIGFRGVNFLFEIKDKGKRKRLTPAQVEFHQLYPGKVYVIETAEEMIAILMKEAA
jgi:hypothetical protein